MMNSVSLEHPNESVESAVPGEADLREILDAAERRKDAEWTHKSRKVSLFLSIPAAVLVLCVVGFLIQYDSSETPEPPKSAAIVPGAEQLAADPEMAAFDSFRPKPQTAKPEGSVTIGGKVVDKGDIEFISQLLHFSEAADKPVPKQ